LPIPVLDGGHLFFFLIEWVIGRPVEMKHRERAQQVGIFVLILVMIYAFYNDVSRFFEG
jgi:regulator of sigma E protease